MTNEPESQEIHFIQELTDDVLIAGETIRIRDTQAGRRSYTRAVFAAIEGTANHLKILALQWAAENPRLFSNAEIALLREEGYALNAKGEAYTQPRFIRTEDNLVFALRMYMRDLPAEFEIDRGGRGWQSFLDGLGVRHRVTHPREIEDLRITDEEMETIQSAFEWFSYTVINNLLNAVTELRRLVADRGLRQ